MASSGNMKALMVSSSTKDFLSSVAKQHGHVFQVRGGQNPDIPGLLDAIASGDQKGLSHRSMDAMRELARRIFFPGHSTLSKARAQLLEQAVQYMPIVPLKDGFGTSPEANWPNDRSNSQLLQVSQLLPLSICPSTRHHVPSVVLSSPFAVRKL